MGRRSPQARGRFEESDPLSPLRETVRQGEAQERQAGAAQPIAAERQQVGAVIGAGPVVDTTSADYGRRHVFREPDTGVYRVLMLKRNRVVGALGVGEWRDSRRLQIAVAKASRAAVAAVEAAGGSVTVAD